MQSTNQFNSIQSINTTNTYTNSNTTELSSLHDDNATSTWEDYATQLVNGQIINNNGNTHSSNAIPNESKPKPSTFRSNGSCALWNTEKYGGNFFSDYTINHQKQIPNGCVSTVLSMLTGTLASEFRNPNGKYAVNTQDPVEWSEALENFSMKLANISTDCRKLYFYKDELLQYNDLWTISYYTPEDPYDIFQDPDDDGRICGSHIVILHRNIIYDSCRNGPISIEKHGLLNKYVKRIFRVVPSNHSRGL